MDESTKIVSKTIKITAMDSESLDQILRRDGVKAIKDINIKAIAKEIQRKNPAIIKVELTRTCENCGTTYIVGPIQ